MSLLDVISSAITNPEQLGSADQIGSILNTVGAVTATHKAGSPEIMSVVGSVVREALQAHQANVGKQGVEDLINQHAGSSPSTAAVQAIFGGREQQVVEAIAQRTGLDANQIKALLPKLLPLVLQLLQSGAHSGGTGSGANTVLNSFLDSDHDGDVDMGDLISHAGHFLGN